ncbi:MAG: hypothetical protein M3179_01345 [Actinomycetota bacterium]|nr:hypothetical protein [Actinomycetota bacterium]
MRRVIATLTIGAAMALGSVSTAGATHTGCEHGVTANAHSRVPHRNQGTHNAHMKIPYCPPQDAPRHTMGGH